jgi:hypothetical protein
MQLSELYSKWLVFKRLSSYHQYFLSLIFLLFTTTLISSLDLWKGYDDGVGLTIKDWFNIVTPNIQILYGLINFRIGWLKWYILSSLMLASVVLITFYENRMKYITTINDKGNAFPQKHII